MHDGWTRELPQLHGDLTTLREVAASDVYTLFTLFSDPAVTTHMGPSPSTLARFAGFVEWSQQQRRHGHGVCLGIVPKGMTAAVGIIQVRLQPTLSDAEWGFVLGTPFWSTGIFAEAGTLLIDFAFTTLAVQRLEARIAERNARAQAAVQKFGARFEGTLTSTSPEGDRRAPEAVWVLQRQDWQHRERTPGVSGEDAAQRIRAAIEAAESALRQSDAPERVEPYPLFMFDRRRRDESGG